jgi:hypothetical protein
MLVKWDRTPRADIRVSTSLKSFIGDRAKDLYASQGRDGNTMELWSLELQNCGIVARLEFTNEFRYSW